MNWNWNFTTITNMMCTQKLEVKMAMTECSSTLFTLLFMLSKLYCSICGEKQNSII